MSALWRTAACFIGFIYLAQAAFAQEPEKNAATTYLLAAALLSQANADAEQVLNEAYPVLCRDEPFTPEKWSLALERCRPALLEMDQAAGLDECRFGNLCDEHQDKPWLPQMRRLARINYVEAYFQCASGHGGEAVKAWKRTLLLGRRLSLEGELIQSLVSTAIVGTALDSMRRALVEDLLNADELQSLLDLLRCQQYGVADLATGYRGEARAFTRLVNEWMRHDDPMDGFYQYQNRPVEGRVGRVRNWLERVSSEQQQGFTLRQPDDDSETARRRFLQEVDFMQDAYRDVAMLAEQPYYQAAARIRAIDLFFRRQKLDSRRHLVASCMGAHLPSTLRFRARSEAKLHGLSGMASTRLFVLKNGRPPARAEEIEVPEDPFTGRPMLLDANDRRLILRAAVEEPDSDPDWIRKNPFECGIFELPLWKK